MAMPGWTTEDGGLMDTPLLTGRVVRTLQALSQGGLVIDLAEDFPAAADPECVDRIVFRGRVPGYTVAAAALSSSTGWHPVPGGVSGTVDLLDRHRRRRLRILTDADRERICIEILQPGLDSASENAVRQRPHRPTAAAGEDIYGWLERLRRRSRVAARHGDAEALELDRPGRGPLRLALHTVNEERRLKGSK